MAVAIKVLSAQFDWWPRLRPRAQRTGMLSAVLRLRATLDPHFV
jgi:hypothetical protein